MVFETKQDLIDIRINKRIYILGFVNFAIKQNPYKVPEFSKGKL